MDSIKNYIQKHKWLFWLWISIDFVIIFLPQWLDSVWSLAEKILGRTIAIPNITWTYWITVPVGLAMFVFAIWAVRIKKPLTVEMKPVIPKNENPSDILTQMHRRLVEIQEAKASRTKVSLKQLEKASPIFFDKMGLVKLADYDTFNKNLKRRLRKAVPKKVRNNKQRVYFLVLSKASEIRNEIVKSKDWTLQDGVKAGEWLDAFDWGIKELRDNDPQWKALFQSASDYLKDEVLRELFERHIDFSYTYNSASLIMKYAKKFPDSVSTSLLYATLVGSPISPEKAELALAEILSSVDKRIKEMQNEKLTLIKDTKVKLDAKDTGKVTGMKIQTKTQLDKVEVDVTAENAKEVTGIDVTATNKEFAFRAKTIICSCGNILNINTTHGYKPTVICPNCGKEYKD